MKFTTTYGRGPDLTIEEVVDKAIDDAPDYYDGALEALRRRVLKMQEIVVAMSASLPEDAQRQLAQALGWEERP